MTVVGDKLGHYEIRALVGAGGMGEVYRAHDTQLDRDVAIKVLRPEVAADPDRLARFEREAKLLAALNHSNIATIHGLERVAGELFIAMELVEGETLAELLAERQLSTSDALAIARQIARALSAAHDKGIIHRDLKPSNVAFAADGSVKVLDFGLGKPLGNEPSAGDLSRATTATVQQTESGVILGTTSYMSPEQVRGDATDERTDVWSFGCVLFEMLCGKRAFGGRSMADVFAAVLREEPSWQALPDDTPESVRSLLARCLQKDPAKRYATARSLADLLDAISQDIGAHSHARDTSADTPPSRKRAVAAAVVVVVLAAAALLVYRDVMAPEPAPFAIDTLRPFVTWPSIETGARVSPDGRWISFISAADEGDNLWLRATSGGEARQITQDVAVLDHVWSDDSSEIAYITHESDPVLLHITQPLGGNRPPVELFPRGNEAGLDRWVGRSIYMQRDRVPGRFDLDTLRYESFLRAQPEGGFAAAPSVSPDERRITYSTVQEGQEDIWVADLDGGNAVRLTRDPMRDFSPQWVGNDHIAFLSHRGGEFNLWAVSLEERVPRSLTTAPADIRGFHASADARTMVLEIHESAADVTLVAPSTGASTTLTADSLEDFWPTISADTSRIAYQRAKPDPVVGVGVFEAEILVGRFDGDAVTAERMVADTGFSPRIAPDGAWLMHARLVPPDAGAERQVPQFDLRLIDLETGIARAITQRFKPPRQRIFPVGWTSQNMIWAPDSSTVFFMAYGTDGSEQIQAATVGAPSAGGEAPRTVATAPGSAAILDMSVSPDGRLLAYAVGSRGGPLSVRRVDLDNDRETTVLAGEDVDALRLQGWLADGSLVVLRVRIDPDSRRRVEVVEVKTNGEAVSLGEIDDVIDYNAVLDPTTENLYLIRVQRGIHTLVAYSLPDRSIRPVVANDRPGITFSGLELAPDGHLIYSRQERNDDLWIARRRN